MAFTSRFIGWVSSKLPGMKETIKNPAGRWEDIKKYSKSAAITTTSFGIATAAGYDAYHRYGNDYGRGSAAFFAVGYSSPITAIPLALAQSLKFTGDDLHKQQIRKLQSSFSTQNNLDKFGTIDLLRKASENKLGRDRSALQRTLGNEAFYLHR